MDENQKGKSVDQPKLTTGKGGEVTKMETAKESLGHRQPQLKSVTAPKQASKAATAAVKQKVNALDIFKNKDIEVHMRNGDVLKCKLDATTQYEMVVTMDKMPVIIFKHGVDYITLGSSLL